MSCTKINPCTCLGIQTPTTPTPCPTPSNCLTLCNIIIPPDESVGPCDKTGNIPFDNFDYGACGVTTPTLQVINLAEIEEQGYITIDSIDETGLTFTTTDQAVGNGKVEVCIQGTCGIFQDIATIIIYIKDLCEGVICIEENFFCNPCSGACEVICPDISAPDSISGKHSSADISIT